MDVVVNAGRPGAARQLNAAEWVNLLGRLAPQLPIAVLVLIAGITSLLAGAGLSLLYARASPSPGGSPKGERTRSPRIGIGRLISGPTAAALGSLVGLLIAGQLGEFAGNPVCALGFGVGQQVSSGDESERDWGHWRSVFVAGWIGGWVGQLTAQFVLTALPAGLRFNLATPVFSGQVPTSEVFGYLVGVGVALVVKAGGRAVAIGSDVDTATAGTLAGLSWIAVVAALGLLVVPLSDIAGLGGLLLGPPSHLTRPLGRWSIPFGIGAVTSILACALLLPRIVASQRHFSMTLERDEAKRVRSIDYRNQFGSMAGPGAFSGLILTLVFLYAFVAGTGARIGSWEIIAGVLLCGVALGAILSVAASAKFDMFAAQREIEQAVGRDGSGTFDPILLTPAPLQVIGELLFGAVTGLSLAGTAYFLVLVWLGQVALVDFALGIVLSAILTAVLVVVFVRTQKSHLPWRPVHPPESSG